jgi:uncharacterized protein
MYGETNIAMQGGIIKFAMAIGLMNLTFVSLATSFDCAKAVSASENIICADIELSQKDDELSQMYQQAKALVGNDPQFRQHNLDAWRWREASCFDRNCLLEWYAGRKNYFNQILSQESSYKSSATIKSEKCKRLGLVPGTNDYRQCIQ